MICSALSLSIGQTIFLNGLGGSAHALTPSIADDTLIKAGANNLRSLAKDQEVYELLRQVYANALHDTYIFPVAVAGMALLAALAIEHKNIKTIGKEREKAREVTANKPRDTSTSSEVEKA